MASINLSETLNYNLLNEIAKYLRPHEIVALLSVSKHFNKFWNSNITEKIFPDLENYRVINLRTRWKLTKIKNIEAENLNFPIKCTCISKENSPFKISFDPLKITLFIQNNFAVWLPESDETKYLMTIDEGDSVWLSAYGNNNLAIFYKNNSLVFYSDDGTILARNNLTNLNWITASKMFYLKGERYLIILNSLTEIAFINSLTGKVIKKQKLESSITMLRPLTHDTVICLSGRKLWAISPWLVKLLISFPGDLPFDFWYNQENQKIVLHSQYRNYLLEKDPSVILKVCDGKTYFVNNKLLKVPYNISGENLVICEEEPQIQYETPMVGQVLNIVGDDNIFIVHIALNPYSYQKHYIMYFYIWGEKQHFYEKHFNKSLEILEFKFPHLVYMISNSDSINDIYVMRL